MASLSKFRFMREGGERSTETVSSTDVHGQPPLDQGGQTSVTSGECLSCYDYIRKCADCGSEIDVGLCEMVDGQAVTTSKKLSVLTFNRDYDFSSVVARHDRAVIGDPSKMVLDIDLSTVVREYRYWTVNQLVYLYPCHGLVLPQRKTLEVLKGILSNHVCTIGRCLPSLYAFKARVKGRKNVEVMLTMQLARQFVVNSTRENGKTSEDRRGADRSFICQHQAVVEEDVDDNEDSHLSLLDDEALRDIVIEWQQKTALSGVYNCVCTVCSRRTADAKCREIECSVVDLTLLRNPNLPDKVLPKSYNIEAFQHAILDPVGLKTRDRPTVMVICLECEEQLTRHHRQPRFALANFLYFGHHELPDNVRVAFETASVFEKVLVSRARASRICVKFSDIVGHALYGTDRATSQKCVNGNVIINPQDALNLTKVLPPPPEFIRDTVCALFVGKEKPTRSTIKDLNPILVRKTRVLDMITFLVENNPYYRVDNEFYGFSQQNMDALFGGDDRDADVGIPWALEVDFVPLDEESATMSAVSDHTRRNEFERVTEEGARNRELLIENVGFTKGDNSPESYQAMKLAALSHCLKAGLFIKSLSGNMPIPDFENPSLLSWLFPHLDPWGLAGFHHPQRTTRLSQEEQLKYMLSINDRRFEVDANFAFVYYNIHQKKAVLQHVSFSTPASRQETIVKDILALNGHRLSEYRQKVERDPAYQPSDEEELAIAKVLNDVSFVGYKLPGTHAYKFARRNEIRSLIAYRGTATLFITLNPADIHHPLVRMFAGSTVNAKCLDETEEMGEWRRRVLVAKRPAAAARFFDFMISTFIDVVLRYGRKDRGVFGRCTSYYAMVETQGRGTLHCHMLVWLKGHLSPQALRDRMVASDEYRTKMFKWLEDLIKCHLPGETRCVEESEGKNLQRPMRMSCDPHPASVLPRFLGDVSMENFRSELDGDVTLLVNELNWHEHTGSCFKYVKRGQKVTEENKDRLCRMRIDGSTRPETTLDPDTHAILLRRLHPRIAPYNDIVTFCIRGNTDIKYIGSGEAAKALMYYVTDYITKDGLPIHVALSALIHATKKLKERSEEEWYDVGKFSRSALTTVVNSMMIRQEMSHQQIMSNVVGGGDHYTPELFAVLYRGSFSSLVDSEGVQNDREAVAVQEDTVVVRMSPGNVTIGNQRMDYLYRSIDEPFNGMSLYEFVEHAIVMRMTQGELVLASTGKLNGRLSSPRHPLYYTHVMKQRRKLVVPVLLGKPIPRPDRSEEDQEEWAKEMLILFKPWREVSDLRPKETSWLSTFNAFYLTMSPKYARIVKNMNVLNECKDARREAALWSQEGDGSHDDRVMSNHDFDVLFDGGALDIPSAHVFDELEQQYSTVVELGSAFQNRNTLAIFSKFDDGGDIIQDATDGVGGDDPEINEMSVARAVDVKREEAHMKGLKKKMRDDDQDDELLMDTRLRRSRRERNPTLTVEDLERDFAGLHIGTSDRVNTLWAIAGDVIAEMSLDTNPEQLRAFNIVAKHLFEGRDQLLMYVAGVGGTGKSHLVQAFVLLFEKTGRRGELLLGGPTGISAVVIGGTTLHKLVMWSDSRRKKNFRDLREFWAPVRYLIVDEISMVSARFLSVISSRLQQARGEYPDQARQPFGGLNIIFMGDFGQLRPVKSQSVFAYNLTERQSSQEARNADSINAVNGAFLWRQVNVCVILKINQRQINDPGYAQLLSRVRVGESLRSPSKQVTGEYVPSDLEVLRERELWRIAERSEEEFSNFRYAPVIVGDRMLRDELNALLLVKHSRRLGKRVSLYYSRDTIHKAPPSDEVKKQLWTMPPKLTSEFFGKLPLFTGMRVMVIDNVAISGRVVNGAEGTVKHVLYETDRDGRRFASVVYVHIPGSSVNIPGLEDEVVPIFPMACNFEVNVTVNGTKFKKYVTRMQLPLVPAYSYTDFKSQGRSLGYAIVDIASAYSLQGVYVMLSRVKTLEGVAVLRWFSPGKIYQRLAEDIRNELDRINRLDTLTRTVYDQGLL